MDKNYENYDWFASISQLNRRAMKNGFSDILIIDFECRGIVKMDKYQHQFASVLLLIEGYGEWVQGYFDKGFRVYLG